MLRTFVRHASSSVEIQLLQDIPQVGVRGEVLRVSRGHMRNYLQLNNRAAYIVKGQQPPLPVVKREVKPVVTKTKAAEDVAEPSAVKKTATETAKPAPTLEDLGALLQKASKRKDSVFGGAQFQKSSSSDAALDYSVSDLKVIPDHYTHTGKLPVTRADLAAVIVKYTGIAVPENQIRVNHGTVTIEGAIEAAGEYTWTINVPADQDSVTKKLTIASK
ncbi:hypothetical protein DIURU_001317 [Diutina rugosa]|uniref:Ribosomal protein L9 domain-containing protein n=1 Tax=Diutina rugosa TaxID=5481 RepID=A0A642UUV6_DIURU|nr:uncharacterized protein DIURU_001317 [Diutina rugosa]KAA8905940.1 hypothetical protein DIURU_001317 [Diutina rugosa]